MSISANDKAALIGYYRMCQDYELIADIMGLDVEVVVKIICKYFNREKNKREIP